MPDVYKVKIPSEYRQGGEFEMVRERVAVLPLANLSPDAQDDYLADGMTEELIAAISRVQGLRVIARTSIMRFKNKDKDKDILDIGRELRAGTLLEGSVRKLGERIRVTVQLIDAKTEEHLWASEYDSDMTDIFSIQSDIARKVGEALRPELSPGPQNEKRAVNLQAYESYLKGRFYWNKRTPEGVSEALKLFKDATAKDPEFAKAYSGIADCYIILKEFGYFTAQEANRLAGDAVATTLELDDSIAEAHASVGLQLTGRGMYQEATAEFKKALALNPSYASAHRWYSIELAAAGDLEGAIREASLAVESDPLSSPAKNMLATAYCWARDFDKAISLYEEILQLDPGFVNARGGLSFIYAYRGEEAKAMSEMELAFATGDEYRRRWGRSVVLALFRHREKALAEAKKAERLAPEADWIGMMYAEIYACLGEADEFFKWIPVALEGKHISIEDMRYAQWLDKVRTDSRYAKLLKDLDSSQS